MSEAAFAAALVRDWVAYREGRLPVDQSHFLTLFGFDHDRATLDLIFAGLPNADALAVRMQRVRAAHHNRIRGVETLTPDQALVTARAELDEKIAMVSDAGDEELLGIIAAVEPVLCEDKPAFERARHADWPAGGLHDTLCDHSAGLWHDTGSIRYALHEAFYGIANDYDVARYAQQPLMRTALSVEPTLLLWEAGYQTALSHEAYLVQREKGSA